MGVYEEQIVLLTEGRMRRDEEKRLCNMAEVGAKLPSKKQLRMMAALSSFIGKDSFDDK